MLGPMKLVDAVFSVDAFPDAVLLARGAPYMGIEAILAELDAADRVPQDLKADGYDYVLEGELIQRLLHDAKGRSGIAPKLWLN